MPALSSLGYNGTLHESSTCWQLLGNGRRAFNPVLMRFHSPDPLSPFGRGGINAYAYCWNDPINLSDPSGLSPLIIASAAMAASKAAAIAKAGALARQPFLKFAAPSQPQVSVGGVGVRLNPRAKEFVPGGSGFNPEASEFVPRSQVGAAAGQGGSSQSSLARTHEVPVSMAQAPPSGPGRPPATISTEDMPPVVRQGFKEAMERIRAGKKNFPKDGSTFQNKGKVLPEQPHRTSYRSYALHLEGETKVGPMRLITGGAPKYNPRLGMRHEVFNPEEVYFSNNHYHTFYRVLDP